MLIIIYILYNVSSVLCNTDGLCRQMHVFIHVINK